MGTNTPKQIDQNKVIAIILAAVGTMLLAFAYTGEWPDVGLPQQGQQQGYPQQGYPQQGQQGYPQQGAIDFNYIHRTQNQIGDEQFNSWMSNSNRAHDIPNSESSWGRDHSDY